MFEVSGRQQSQILTILLVNALDVLRDHELNPRAQLCVRTLLSAAAFPAALSADRGHKSAALHITTLDGKSHAALQSEIWDLTQRLVKIKAIVRKA